MCTKINLAKFSAILRGWIWRNLFWAKISSYTVCTVLKVWYVRYIWYVQYIQFVLVCVYVHLLIGVHLLLSYMYMYMNVTRPWQIILKIGRIIL